MSSEFAKVDSLGKFIDAVSELRGFWGLPKHKELWFRGEAQDYGDTILRPELYRPVKGKPLKPISKLLSIENHLSDEFRRNAVEYVPTSDDWDWDSYFLMQHHECPTRLLDWSDGALMAMHFALRDKKHDDKDARVYVLAVDRLNEQLKQLPDVQIAKAAWKDLAAKRPSYELDEDLWEGSYLPSDDDDRAELNVPRPPLILDFPHITRRIAQQIYRVRDGTQLAIRRIHKDGHDHQVDPHSKRTPTNNQARIERLRPYGIGYLSRFGRTGTRNEAALGRSEGCSRRERLIFTRNPQILHGRSDCAKTIRETRPVPFGACIPLGAT